MNTHLAVYLIWQGDSTKGAKKNTSPNVIQLQYIIDNSVAVNVSVTAVIFN